MPALPGRDAGSYPISTSTSSGLTESPLATCTALISPARASIERARVPMMPSRAMSSTSSAATFCVTRKGGEQAFPRTDAGLDIRVVGDPGATEALRVVRHPVEDESVQTVAGPRETASERFENEEWLAELLAPFHGPL